MLANLDNEVHFKKVFTDVEVFTAFVKDVLGIDLSISKVETEKMLPTQTSAIKFRMDLFAEDEKNRTVVEIQKVDYDYTYDRFTHYFTANLVDMQRSSRTYEYAKELYVIVVVTSIYRVSDKNGVLLRDDVLVTDINPRTLEGEVREMYNHKMVILNTMHIKPDTPVAIRDWLELIIESKKNPQNPRVNTRKPAIAKALELGQMEHITPEERADAKIEEMRKVAIGKIETNTLKEIEEAKKEIEDAKKETEEVKKKIEEAKKETEEAKKETEEAKKKSEEAKKEVEQLKKEAEAREEKSRREAEAATAQLIMNLYREGTPADKIASLLQKTPQDIEAILAKYR